MSTIYENLNAIEELLNEIYEKEQDENSLKNETWLKEQKEQILQIGLEKLCMVRQNRLALIKALKDEEERMKTKRQSEEKKLENLESYISQILFMSGENKKQAGTFTVSFRKSTKVILDEFNFNDERFITIEEVKKFDKMAIKEALQNGEQIQGVYLQENKNLNIK